MIERIDEFIGRAYKTACEHGFHDEKTSLSHQMMLVIGEIGECVEADRKGRRANLELFGKFSQIDFADSFKCNIKDTMEDEMADICIRLFDMCGCFEIEPLCAKVDLGKEWDNCFGKLSFTEQAYALVMILCDCDEGTEASELEEIIGASLCFLDLWAKSRNFDLAKHIDLKMRYNEGRAYKHGKKY